MTSTDALPLKCIDIGNQTWSGENVSIHVDGTVCYNNDPENCRIFGPLYTYAQAIEGAKKFAGWRLPTRNDVDILISFLGGATTAGKELKAGGSTGFNALMAGFRDAKSGNYYRIGKQTGFWTSTEEDEDTAWKFYFTIEKENINFHPVSKKYGDSIRLIKIIS